MEPDCEQVCGRERKREMEREDRRNSKVERKAIKVYIIL